MMKVKDIVYSDDEILRMAYYFQNKSLVCIISGWIKLKFRKKASSSEILKIKRAGVMPDKCDGCGGRLNIYTGSHTCVRNEALNGGVKWLCVKCFEDMR